jgi:hypothetical protein
MGSVTHAIAHGSLMGARGINWLISPYNGLSSANGLSVYTPLK